MEMRRIRERDARARHWFDERGVFMKNVFQRRTKNWLFLALVGTFFIISAGSQALAEGLFISTAAAHEERIGVDEKFTVLGSGIHNRKLGTLQLACLNPEADPQKCTRMRFLMTTTSGERKWVGIFIDISGLLTSVQDHKPKFDSLTVGSTIFLVLAFCRGGEFCPRNLGERILMVTTGLVLTPVLTPVGLVTDVVQLISLPPRRLIYKKKYRSIIEALTNERPADPPKSVGRGAIRLFLEIVGAGHEVE